MEKHMGPANAAGGAHQQPTNLPELDQVRLVDARASASAGGMSLSWWHEAVSQGIAPQPVFRAPRCTRWRAVDVAAFWRDYRPSTDRAVEVVDQAAKASAKARERRLAKAATASEGP
jgi:predicted DNA-binding transcriptional regulator AlpA